jgi:glycosyltransferase involved in cell wall biosynthesis
LKILFLTDNFPPEVNAPATRTFEHCCEWVKNGVEVTIITCAPNFPQGKVYPGYKNKLVQSEVMQGIKVIRVWTYITANEGFIRRTIDYLSFAIAAFWAGLFIKTDIIIATSPQFFTAASGRWLSFFKRKPWIMEVRDLWPESIKNVGAAKDGPIIRFFEWWEKRLYKTSKHIVVVTDAFKEAIIKKSINGDKISVVKNGANLELYQPGEKNQQLAESLGLEGKKVVGYIGTHGMAHKLDFILRCAQKVQEKNYHFLFIGAGAEKANLLKLRDELNLTNVTFLDPVEKQLVPGYISITDISLIPLRNSELFKTVIPSKIFETSAMGKPILLGVRGESRQIIEEFGAGIYFEPENQADFLQKLEQLSGDNSLYANCIEGCFRLAQNFDRKVLAAKMQELIKQQIN